MIIGFLGLSVNSIPIFVPFGVFWRVCVRMFASGVFLGKLIFMFVGVRESVSVTSFLFIFNAS